MLKPIITPLRAQRYSEIISGLPSWWPVAQRAGQNADKYVNMAITFDIETTSYTQGPFKTCWMYCWQLYINHHVYMGRNWEEFEWTLNKISEHFGGSTVPIYIHNMPFEFSFMKHMFEFRDVFAVRSLTPIRAHWKNIEFRDSLVLSGLPLEKLPTKTKKLKGDLDYSLIRTEKTPLTQKEIDYCVNDVVVLAEYIEGKMKDDDLAHIPMTRTGYVRRDVRERMGKAAKSIRALKLDMKEYRELEELFQGGFTHAAAHTSGMVLYNIRSLDITSSYPTVMCSEMFPISEFWDVEPKDYKYALSHYACKFKVEVKNLQIKEEAPDCILSESKCLLLHRDAIINNGRVVSATLAVFWANEVDLKWYKRFYSGKFTATEFRAARKGYLPKPLVEAMLFYYNEKTKYKGVDEKIDWYNLSKEMLNAGYGMCATKPIKSLIALIGGDWMTLEEFIRRIEKVKKKKGKIEDIDKDYARLLGADSVDNLAEDAESIVNTYFEKLLDDYNNARGRFLYYAWAPWVTSYARQNLFTMMWKCGEDYHYSDTDSLKISNWLIHKPAFDRYNRQIVAKIRKCLKKLKLDPNLATPEDPNHRVRPLGIFTDEGEYWEFKTIGAKRYMTTSLDPKTGEEVLSVTVAGAPKKYITAYMAKQKAPFARFDKSLVVPAEDSGKLMCTHIESEWEGMVTDYTGRRAYVYTHGGTHLEPMPVTMEIAPEYAAYLLMAQAADEMPYIDRGLI